MILIGAGDLHITNSTPRNRIDEYPTTLYNKVKYLIDFANKKQATLILPGDVFDHWKQSNFVLQKYIDLFLTAKKGIYAVRGQHDQKYHSKETDDIAFTVFESAKAIFPLKMHSENNCDFYGCSFGEKIPLLKKTTNFKILVIHQMIVHDSLLWEKQSDFTYAENLLRKHNFDLIISGDNHQAFHVEVQKKHLFNCGSLMRTTKAQIKHKPQFFLFDTETKEYEIHEFPIEDYTKVFNLEKIEKEITEKKKFEAIVSGLKETNTMSLSYADEIDLYLKENNIDQKTIEIFEEVIRV